MPSEFQQAVTRYFDTFGPLDLFDLMGAAAIPAAVRAARGRATLEWFGNAVDDIVERAPQS